MKIVAQRKDILETLQKVTGVIEKAHTIKILSNVLIKAEYDRVTFVATDSDIQIVAKTKCIVHEEGELTVSGRKIVDIFKYLPDLSEVSLSGYNDKLEIKCRKSNFILKTLPAQDFPTFNEIGEGYEFFVEQSNLKKAMDNTVFSMGLQDVRKFLNGIYLRIEKQNLIFVASDGHRLATSKAIIDESSLEPLETIIPRKAALELLRLITEKEKLKTKFVFSNKLMSVEIGNLIFTGKLMDCKFPNYRNVIPNPGENIIKVDTKMFREALGRVSILSNEISRGVLFTIGKNEIVLVSHNHEQEQATEEVPIEYDGDPMVIGFNSSYVLEALKKITSKCFSISIQKQKSMLLSDENFNFDKFLIMPMKI